MSLDQTRCYYYFRYNRNNNVDSIALQHNWIFSSIWFNIRFGRHTPHAHTHISHTEIGIHPIHAHLYGILACSLFTRTIAMKEPKERNPERVDIGRKKRKPFIYIDSFSRQLPYRKLIFLPWVDIFHAKIRTFTNNTVDKYWGRERERESGREKEWVLVSPVEKKQATNSFIFIDCRRLPE